MIILTDPLGSVHVCRQADGDSYINTTRKSVSVDSFEPPVIEWNRTYGDWSSEGPGYSKALAQTSDDGYIMCGTTDFPHGAPDYDFWLVRTDANGNAWWNKTYGTAGHDAASAVVQTIDGGYAIAGTVWMGTFYYADFYLVKTDTFGMSQWNCEYEGGGSEEASSMIQTTDGGYLIVGDKYLPSVGNTDIWLVKTDENGQMQWNKTYGSSANDGARCVIQTIDGGYAVVGFAGGDAWLIKTDVSGNAQWNEKYGGNGDDVLNCIVQTFDGGFLMGGSTRSYGAGWDDLWLVKADDSGNLMWNRTYGGTENDYGSSVVETSDGGYALFGTTWSFGISYDDPWLVKTNVDGNRQWDIVFEGQYNDGGCSLVQTKDGGYALLGSKSQGYPNTDFWLIKLIGDLAPITLAGIEKLPFRLSLEPLQGEWTANSQFRMKLVWFVNGVSEVLDLLEIQEPFCLVAKSWDIVAADKDGDGKLSQQEWSDLLEKWRWDVVDEVIKLGIKYNIELTLQAASEAAHVALDGLGKLGGLVKEYGPPAFGGGVAVVSILYSPAYSISMSAARMINVFGIQIPSPEWSPVGYMLGSGPMRIQTACPVDISVTDTFSRVLNKTQNEIPGARYIEIDLNEDGETEDLVVLPETSLDYTVKVIPEPNAQANDTYTLVVGNTWAGFPIEENNTIQDIPPSGYNISSFDDIYLQSIPPLVRILSPLNKTYYSNAIPLVFETSEATSWIGYSIDNSPNVTISDNTIINVEDGTHQIVICASDTFGNMGSSTLINFSVNSSFYDPWKTSFIALGSYPIVNLAVHNGKLYAASDSTIYVFGGASWNIIHAPSYVTSLVSYNDKLLVGSQGGLWSYDEATFALVFEVPTYIKSLGVYDNTLYAGTFLAKPPILYYCNGSPDNPSDWYVDTSFSSILNFTGPFASIDSFTVYNDNMYVTSGGLVYCYNETGWNIANTYDDVYAYLDIGVHNGKLYLATRDQAWRKPLYQGGTGFSGRVIEFDGSSWTTIFDHDYWIFSLETYGNKLFVGTANKIYTYDGANWNTSLSAIEGAYYAISFITFNDEIYVGMGNGYIFVDPEPETITIPEFPPVIILPLLILSILAVVLAVKKTRDLNFKPHFSNLPFPFLKQVELVSFRCHIWDITCRPKFSSSRLDSENASNP
jgi:hypothetical protein